MDVLNIAQLGVLKSITLPAAYKWMGDIEVRLILELRTENHGITRKTASSRFTRHLDRWIRFECSGLVEWEYDRRGRPSLLKLSWKGQEVADLVYTRALAAQESQAIKSDDDFEDESVVDLSNEEQIDDAPEENSTPYLTEADTQGEALCGG